MNKLSALFLIVIISCKKEINETHLIGNWKMKDLINKTEKGIDEKTTFYTDSTFSIQTSTKDSIIEQHRGKYIYNNDNQTIKMNITINNHKHSYTLKLEELSDTNMTTYNPATDTSTRFIRVN